MKASIHVLLIAAVCTVWIACSAAPNPTLSDQADSASVAKSSEESEPLLLDDSPLLLSDEGMNLGEAEGPVADNSRCHVCHMNYMQEEIAVFHARAYIGCADCHGESDVHIDDESWASGGTGTAPEVMFTREEVNPFCMSCHPQESLDTQQHKPLFSDSTPDINCTDCHGDHRLEHRITNWK